MTDKRADMPDQIWAWYLHPKIQNDELQGGWTMNHDPKEAEYLRATHERRAAPDLLAALEALDAFWLQILPNGPPADGEPHWLTAETIKVWRDARAAIAKARGQV